MGGMSGGLESKASRREVSQHSVAYFSRLRESYLQHLKDQQQVSFHKLQRPSTEEKGKQP